MLPRKIALLLIFSLAGCASKVLILQSPIVSMKKADAGAQKELAPAAAVNEKWCATDKPVVPNDDGSKHYGMIDQVIWKAHKKSRYDFFVNAKFYQQGDCVSMNAMGAGAQAAAGNGGSSKKTKMSPLKKASAKTTIGNPTSASEGILPARTILVRGHWRAHRAPLLENRQQG